MIDWNLLYFRGAPSTAHGMVVSLVRGGYFHQAGELLFDECVLACYRKNRFFGHACYDEKNSPVRSLSLSIRFLKSQISSLQLYFFAAVPYSKVENNISTRIQRVYHEFAPLLVQEGKNARILEFLSMGRGDDAIDECLFKISSRSGSMY